MCSAKWSDLEKARSHRWHWNGRCPVCLRKWRVSSSERANFHPQPSQLQWYGFSPARTERSALAVWSAVRHDARRASKLTGVRPQMRLQVGALRVGLPAARERAGVSGACHSGIPKSCGGNWKSGSKLPLAPKTITSVLFLFN
uniref:Uncharacterized protein n=1 Tax=Oryzias melastigma TaxID=30732 RepID=A0A3B3C1E6_ORYME